MSTKSENLTGNSRFQAAIASSISEAIEKEADILFEQAKEDVIVKLDLAKNKIVATIVIGVMSQVKMQDFGNELVITVVTDKLKGGEKL